MGDNGFLTVKELAETVGVSKQAIYKRLDKDLQPFVKELNGQKVLNYKVLEVFSDNQFNQTVETVETVETFKNMVTILQKQVDLMEKELDNKEENIRILQSEIAKEREYSREQAIKVSQIADQAQRLQLAQLTKDKPLEITEQDIQLLKEHCIKTDEKIMQIKERLAETKEQPKENQGFFSRMFGK